MPTCILSSLQPQPSTYVTLKPIVAATTALVIITMAAIRCGMLQIGCGLHSVGITMFVLMAAFNGYWYLRIPEETKMLISQIDERGKNLKLNLHEKLKLVKISVSGALSADFRGSDQERKIVQETMKELAETSAKFAKENHITLLEDFNKAHNRLGELAS